MNSTPDTTDPPTTFRIDILREADDGPTASFETSDRVGESIVDADLGSRYYAILNLASPAAMRLARSSTIAGPRQVNEPAPEPQFVKATPRDSEGLVTTPAPAPVEEPVEWTWEGADSSPK